MNARFTLNGLKGAEGPLMLSLRRPSIETIGEFLASQSKLRFDHREMEPLRPEIGEVPEAGHALETNLGVYE